MYWFYGKNDLRVEERDIPEIGRNDVLVRVHACGICGTDVHIFCGDEGAVTHARKHGFRYHEFAGEVVKVGAGVTSAALGDKVCVDPNKLCGSCDFCRRGDRAFLYRYNRYRHNEVDGGFAEYCAVPSFAGL